MATSSRLLARLLPLIVPLAGCGGSTTSDTGATGAPGAGGSSAQGTGGGNATGGTGAQGGNATGGSGAQGGSATAGSGGSSVAGQGGGSALCNETAPLVPGVDTGFFLCTGSAIHRTTIGACPNVLPIPNGACTGSGGPPGGCVDTDCTASPHGYCAPNAGGGALFCMCHYGCVTDTECASGQICLCDANIGTCVAATCTKDADCQGGSVCLSYGVVGSCSATTQFACTTPQDQCHSDTDCPSDGGLPNICGHDGAKRLCVPGPGLCAGRPLFVANAVRLAGLLRGGGARGRGWSELA